jgi:hypothetical protein
MIAQITGNCNPTESGKRCVFAGYKGKNSGNLPQIRDLRILSFCAIVYEIKIQEDGYERDF